MTSTIDDVLSGRARWCVVHADCLHVLPTLGPVDHVITDGPYGVGTNDLTADDEPYVAALRMVETCPSRAFFGYAEWLVSWIGQLGWGKPNEWVTWYPSNAEVKAGSRSKHSLPKSAEHVAIYGPLPGVRSVRRERSKGGQKLAGKLINTRWSGGRPLEETAQAGDVWGDPSPGIAFQSHRRLHPNEKPESLLEKLVALVSKPDALVLDMFAGSGTTGVAALRLGRRVILIEKDAGYAALIRQRMEAEENGSTLEAARAGQVPMFGGSR